RFGREVWGLLGGEGKGVVGGLGMERTYWERFPVRKDVRFVDLRGDFALIEKQLRDRRGHFMNPALLRSQFAGLEEPASDEEVLTVELGQTPKELVEEIKAKLNLVGSG